MRTIISLVIAVFALCSLHAQEYVHYYMNNGTFNGFYTDKNIEINHELNVHNKFVTNIYNNGNKYTVPVETIDSIVVEDALVDVDYEGDYRIYEGSFEDQPFRHLFVDTRACLFASKNGDFGVNDTILYASVYNNEKVLFITNELGKIQNVFTNEKLFFYDYNGGILENIIEITETGYIERDDMMTIYNQSSRHSYDLRNVVPMQLSTKAEFFAGLGTNSFNVGANALAHFLGNPENYVGILLLDGLSIAGDLVGISASCVAGIPTGGWSLAGFEASVGFLMADVIGLYNDLFPDYKQIEKYQEYYKNKYAISLRILPAENVKINKADLKGLFSSLNGVKGNLYFTLISEDELEHEGNTGLMIPATSESINDMLLELTGNATDLTVDKWYCYSLHYDVAVNRFNFKYETELSSFRTQKPSAETGELVNSEQNSATVKASFVNIPNGAQCGIRYSIAGDPDADYMLAWGVPTEGEQTIQINGLEPSTTYTYRAIIECQGNTYLGEPKNFSTSPLDISGTWNVVETYSTRPFPGAEWQTKTREYSLTLNKDGSIQVFGLGYEYIAGSWEYDNGRFSATCHIIATQTQNSWDRFDGRADDHKNPTKITGTRYSGNMNQVTNVEDAVGSFVMTR